MLYTMQLFMAIAKLRAWSNNSFCINGLAVLVVGVVSSISSMVGTSLAVSYMSDNKSISWALCEGFIVESTTGRNNGKCCKLCWETCNAELFV